MNSRLHEMMQRILERASEKIDCKEADMSLDQQVQRLSELELSDEQQKEIQLLQELYEANLAYASGYAFCCGVMHGYEGFLSVNARYSFDAAVEKGLHAMPGLADHKGYHINCMRINELCGKLEGQLSDRERDAIFDLCCAFDDRTYRASYSFFCSGMIAAKEMICKANPRAKESDLVSIEC